MKKKSLYINIFFQKTPNFWKATRVSAASYIERKGINKGRSSQKKSDREKKEVRKKNKKNKKKSCNVIRRYTQWMERKKKEAFGEKKISFIHRRCCRRIFSSEHHIPVQESRRSSSLIIGEMKAPWTALHHSTVHTQVGYIIFQL
jgi:hypothetical protein